MSKQKNLHLRHPMERNYPLNDELVNGRRPEVLGKGVALNRQERRRLKQMKRPKGG
jgi:hypothetical protein